MHRILLIDDDSNILETYRVLLEGQGYCVDVASTGEQACRQVRRSPYRYSLVILDYRLKGENGATVVDQLTALQSDLYVLIYSADSSREAILSTTRRGARGFVHKSEGLEIFLEEIKRWCRKFAETQACVFSQSAPSHIENEIKKQGMVSRSPLMLALSRQINALKKRQGAILVVGESGTGKELIARALHDSGSFLAVNCGQFASNPQLVASTLFGHVKGAFTGAHVSRKGVFEEAKNGTVFLDEIDLLPLESQLALLRVLQERVVTPVGSTQEIPVRFRLVCSAKPSIHKAIKEGKFKEDLYFRIARSLLNVPPLRERTEDIGILIRHFCQLWSKENNESKTVLQRAANLLCRYSWPGNVRELQNTIFHLLDTVDKKKIGPEHLDAHFFEQTIPSEKISFKELRQQWLEQEQVYLIQVLSKSRSAREAARTLEIPEPTLRRLMKKHQIDPSRHLLKNISGAQS